MVDDVLIQSLKKHIYGMVLVTKLRSSAPSEKLSQNSISSQKCNKIKDIFDKIKTSHLNPSNHGHYKGHIQ